MTNHGRVTLPRYVPFVVRGVALASKRTGEAMKRIILAVSAVATVAFMGSAMAEPEPKGNANGVYGCVFGTANPGELVRGIREVTGLNPKQAADVFDVSVGEGIGIVCGNPNPVGNPD